jgi:hypothetical protein
MHLEGEPYIIIYTNDADDETQGTYLFVAICTIVMIHTIPIDPLEAMMFASLHSRYIYIPCKVSSFCSLVATLLSQLAARIPRRRRRRYDHLGVPKVNICTHMLVEIKQIVRH